LTDRATDTGKVLRVTIAAALVPGLGHLLLGRLSTAVPVLGLMAGGVTAAALHMTQGLQLFATHSGVFAFAVMLRGLAILYGFSVVDAYLWALDPAGRGAPPLRRQAVLANLMLPGLGYLLARAWVRGALALALVGFIVFLASKAHPFADLALMVIQAITGFAVYYQLRVQEERQARRDNRQLPEPMRHVESAQLVILVVLALALVWSGYVMQKRLPPGGLGDLSLGDLRVRTEAGGIHFSAPPLGVSLSATGYGWTRSRRPAGSLFHATHDLRASLELKIQRIPAFLPDDLLLRRIRRYVESQGFSYRRSQPLRVNDHEATEMRFFGSFSQGRVEQRAVVVPHGKIAYLVLLSCVSESCPKVERQLQRSLDSLKLED
jgi:hypothetical protein